MKERGLLGLTRKPPRTGELCMTKISSRGAAAPRRISAEYTGPTTHIGVANVAALSKRDLLLPTVSRDL